MTATPLFLTLPSPTNNIPPPGWSVELDRKEELSELTWLAARR
jgi:hypothetical protein